MTVAVPHLRPWVLPGDAEVLEQCLREHSVCHWRRAETLAQALGDYAGWLGCRLYATGTLALRAGLLGLELPPGSGVGIPSFTCGEVLCGVVSAGLDPVVLDCDEEGLMIGAAAVRAFSSGRIRAAVAIHQFGLVNRGMEVATRLMPVIEDCCHVPPRAYLDGTRSVFGSLEGTKLLGAGEGGYLLSPGPVRAEGPREPASLGRRLSDLIAVLALRQLGRLEENLCRRAAIAARYRAACSGQTVVDGERAAWFRFLLRLDSQEAVDRFIQEGEAAGVTLKRPILPHPLHGYSDSTRASCPRCDAVWRRLVSVPLYPDLSEEEVAAVAHFLRERALE